ncbi:hypothetical protein C4D60_Mb06t27770 [Musa balbisiana]|uniref:Uncharacterized protein n=1 Tax=Musa balbisiana TaxID=52838 RepID=A0A4S8IR42_MUSBA|nr:hypothetical protein C4D60_Mb06t27750 [Musa balbisiana]THU51129.1 hypothetical protein C4D60_Mb06t27770 [Musa balbisiana]
MRMNVKKTTTRNKSLRNSTRGTTPIRQREEGERREDVVGNGVLGLIMVLGIWPSWYFSLPVTDYQSPPPPLELPN